MEASLRRLRLHAEHIMLGSKAANSHGYDVPPAVGMWRLTTRGDISCYSQFEVHFDRDVDFRPCEAELRWGKIQKG